MSTPYICATIIAAIYIVMWGIITVNRIWHEESELVKAKVVKESNDKHGNNRY